MVKLIPGLAPPAAEPPRPPSWAGYKNALFLSCCESNAVPLLLRKKYWRCSHLLQNPGNIVPPPGLPGAVAAELERAYQAGVRTFVVCGHHPCSLVQALVDPAAGPAPGPALAAWLELAVQTRRVMAQSYGDLEGPARLEAAAQAHVLLQLQALAAYPLLAAGVADGSVALHGWLANGASGQLYRFDPAQGQFEPLLRTGWKPA
jgi:carbonic anhydrase